MEAQCLYCGVGAQFCYVISTNCSIQSVTKNFRIFSVIRNANAVGQKRVEGRTDRQTDRGTYVNGQSVTRTVAQIGTYDWTDRWKLENGL